MESLSVELQDVITKVAKENGIENFTVNISKSVCKEGDGYIGILEALCITDKDSDNKLNLVIKRAPPSESLRKQFPTRPAFLREIVLYEEVFPEIKSFQEEHNIPHPFNCVPKLYGYIDDEFKEVLLLRNLKEDGFKLCNRLEPMDSQHLSMVLTAYARLHAVSHAMRRLEPERFKKVTAKIRSNVIMDFRGTSKLTDTLNNINDPASLTIADSLFASTFEAVKDNPRLTEAVQNVKTNFFTFFFKESLRLAENEFAVITHSDCWSTNMLFKYEEESNPNIPTELYLIDWQMSNLTHPVHDISYFFFISAGKKDLKNYMRYLKMYHAVLCENLAAFGLDPKSFYSFGVLEEQWKKYCRLGFFMCLIMLKQTLSETKTHDFQKMAEEGKDVFDLNQRGNNISDRFKQRMSDLVEFLADNQLI